MTVEYESISTQNSDDIKKKTQDISINLWKSGKNAIRVNIIQSRATAGYGILIRDHVLANLHNNNNNNWK